MLVKIRTVANIIMVCIAIERTFAELKRDRLRRKSLLQTQKRHG